MRVFSWLKEAALTAYFFCIRVVFECALLANRMLFRRRPADVLRLRHELTKWLIEEKQCVFVSDGTTAHFNEFVSYNFGSLPMDAPMVAVRHPDASLHRYLCICVVDAREVPYFSSDDDKPLGSRVCELEVTVYDPKGKIQIHLIDGIRAFWLNRGLTRDPVFGAGLFETKLSLTSAKNAVEQLFLPKNVSEFEDVGRKHEQLFADMNSASTW